MNQVEDTDTRQHVIGCVDADDDEQYADTGEE
jgi:hypothetical protein